MQKLSDLNYKIVDKKGKEFMVHINRLKKSYEQTLWSFENARRPRQKTKQLDTEETLDGNVEIQSRCLSPLVMKANHRFSKRKPWWRNNNS